MKKFLVIETFNPKQFDADYVYRKGDIIDLPEGQTTKMMENIGLISPINETEIKLLKDTNSIIFNI
jgi:hypothetical protein